MTDSKTGKGARASAGKPGMDESFLEFTPRSGARPAQGRAAGQQADMDPKNEEAARRRRAAARLAAKKRQQKKRRNTLIAVLMFLLAAMTLLVWAVIVLIRNCNGEPTPISGGQITVLDENRVLSRNTTINGIAVGEMTVFDARAAVSAQMENMLAGVAIRLEGEGISYTLTRKELGITYELDAALLNAVNARGSAQQVAIDADSNVLRDSLYALNETIPNHAVNASFTIEYDQSGAPTFQYTDGQNGMQLDYDAVLASVEAALNAGEYQAVVTPTVTVSEPDITTDDLKAITARRSSYATQYKYRRTSSMTDDDVANVEARDMNITKACTIINGKEIKPGEVFSFNDSTGKRSEDNGWAYAKAVYDGSYRKETGGGVCQVTTTMFNALLQGGLFDITHREHSIPSDYVPLGFDATVDYGSIDFKFRNDTEHSLYLFTYVTQSTDSKYYKVIHVELYGEALESGVEYRCSSVIDEQIPADSPDIIFDKTLPEGEEVITRNPHDKYTVTISVDKYVNGILSENVFSYTTSKYDLIQQQIKVGTSVAPTNTPKATHTPAAGAGAGGEEGG